MAKQEIVTYSYSCDLCGKEIGDDGGAHTVTFGTGSRPGVWEIDLCGTDAKKLDKAEEALKALLASGRRVTGGRQRSSGAARKSARGSSDANEVRTWARRAGYEVSDRGRIGSALREAFEARR
jgi:Lsr2